MALFPKFPYLNFHELNLNWLIDQVKTNKNNIEKIDSITADFIISKGQGNFETLRKCGKNIYYIFLCKCDLFANTFQVPKLTGMLINEKYC